MLQIHIKRVSVLFLRNSWWYSKGKCFRCYNDILNVISAYLLLRLFILKISTRELSKVKFLRSFFVEFKLFKLGSVAWRRWTWILYVCQENFAQKIVKLRIFVAILFFVALEKRPFSLCRVAYNKSYVVHKVNLVKLRRDLIVWSKLVRYFTLFRLKVVDNSLFVCSE